MNKNNKKEKKEFRLNSLMVIEIIALFAFVSYYYLSMGLNNKELVTVNYAKNDDNINYKVFIKDEYRSLYGDDYLNQGLTYISDLIDYIDVDFDYDLIFDKRISGTYFYTVKAVTTADVNKDDVSDWTDEKIIFTSDPLVFNDDAMLEIHKNVKLNYNEYQDKMREFKSKAANGLTMTSKVDLRLDITVKDIEDDDIDGVQQISTYALVSIPLVDKNSDINITTDVYDATGSYEKTIELEGIKYIIFDFIGMIFGTLAICLVLVIVLDYIGLLKGISKYNRTLHKILKTYDSIIVTVDKIPDLKDMNVIKVNNMQELLDAHAEVRMPINFIEDIEDVRSQFILIDGKMAWVYTLEDEKAKKL